MVFDKFQLKKLRILNLSQLGVSSSTRSSISRCRSKRGRAVISEQESKELLGALDKVQSVLLNVLEDVNESEKRKIENAQSSQNS